MVKAMNVVLASIVIVNFNGKEYLEKCLTSLKRQTYPNFEVIFVDNNSTDGSCDFIEQNFNDFVRLIKNPINHGFAKANNIGLRIANGKYIVVLNNDTLVDELWLENLIKAAELSKDIGMCASKIYLAQEQGIIDSTGINIYPDGIAKQRGWLEKDSKQYDDKNDVLLPSGCAALYRKEMLDQIGLFDEMFFAYCEDTDLGLRGRLAGWRCVFVPEAKVYHFYSGFWKKHLLRKIFFIERNRILLVYKNFSAGLIVTSYYYYLVRLAYHFIGVLFKKGVVSQYMTNVSLLAILITIIKAHFDAYRHLPQILRKRKKLDNSRGVEASLNQVLKKYAVKVGEITLR